MNLHVFASITIMLYTQIFICTVPSIALGHHPSYDTFFYSKELRIHFWLTNDTSSDEKTNRNEWIGEHLRFQSFTEKKVYAGPKKMLIDPLDYGTYRVVVTKKTGEFIFLKGFNTLFEEWLHTYKGQKIVQSFEQSIGIPYPKKEVDILIQRRNKDNAFVTLWKKHFIPQKESIHLKKVPTSTRPYLLWGNKNISDQIDIIVLPEGYTKDEMKKFAGDARKILEGVFAKEPYSTYKQKYNIWLMNIPSLESGVSIPQNDILRKTAFHCTFNGLGIERYLISRDYWQIHDQISHAPYDHILILVNSSEYGGAGIYNHYSIVTADNPESIEVLSHELAHSIFGLADEYVDTLAYNHSFYSLDVEPWEANITTLKNFDAKWKQKIHDSIPIPTPPVEEYGAVIGVFEGAGYASTGIFRPYLRCEMSELHAPFCPVCSDAISQKTYYLSNGSISIHKKEDHHLK